MKNYLFLFLFGIIAGMSYGQVKEVFINDDFEKLNPSEFEKTEDTYDFFYLRFDLDTLIVNVKVQRIKKGKISAEKNDLIRKELALVSGQEIPKENTILINYYHGESEHRNKDAKNWLGIRYRRFAKQTRKLKNVSQFFMYKSAEGTQDFGRNIQWTKDPSEIFEKTFFPLHYPYGCYVMIDANGNFYMQKGEYSRERILLLLKYPETTFSGNDKFMGKGESFEK